MSARRVKENKQIISYDRNNDIYYVRSISGRMVNYSGLSKNSYNDTLEDNLINPFEIVKNNKPSKNIPNMDKVYRGLALLDKLSYIVASDYNTAKRISDLLGYNVAQGSEEINRNCHARQAQKAAWHTIDNLRKQGYQRFITSDKKVFYSKVILPSKMVVYNVWLSLEGCTSEVETWEDITLTSDKIVIIRGKRVSKKAGDTIRVKTGSKRVSVKAGTILKADGFSG